jgi:tRNA threonylcarbamoyladenosine biosynthesis protein TsaE
MKTFRSYSSAETAQLGREFGEQIKNSGRKGAGKGAFILALQGDIGAGKTTFTQGFARGLGIKRRTASPTFILMRRFAIPRGNSARVGLFKNFYHIDAYRLKKLDSLEPLGLREIFVDPVNIILIEWPEKIKKTLPRGTVWVKFKYGRKENERIISL